MFTVATGPSRSRPCSLLGRLAHAYRVLGARGALIDGPAYPMARRTARIDCVAEPPCAFRPLRAKDLALFVARMRELLATTSEPARRRLEKDVLDLAVPLQASGLFNVLHIAHPALSAMVADHLAAQNDPRPCR